MPTQNHSNACVLVCNSRYLPYARFVADQLGNSAALDADIVICSDEDLGDQAGPIAIARQIDMSAASKDVPAGDRLGIYAFWSIPAIDALTRDYEKILYLDVDLIIESTAIKQLFTADLKGHALAAVRDIHQRQRPGRKAREFKALNWPNAPVFNSGVILIDSAAWKSQDVNARIWDAYARHPDAVTAHDQSLMNIALYRDWAELSPVWNWQFSPRFPFAGEWISPHILHFSGATKPWSKPDGAIPVRYLRRWETFARHEGLDQIFELPANSSFDEPLNMQNSLKAMYHHRGFRRYLARFESDLTTISHRAG